MFGSVIVDPQTSHLKNLQNLVGVKIFRCDDEGSSSFPAEERKPLCVLNLFEEKKISCHKIELESNLERNQVLRKTDVGARLSRWFG